MFSELNIKGELKLDKATQILYSTDASAYKEMPLGAVFPEDTDDINNIIAWAHNNDIPLIPRTAGTSLAGQVVGNGLIVDVSRHLRKIISINTENHSVVVEPGVIRDELNLELKKKGLFFGPETSTSNRCMIGGMLGNNSCGARSLVYGSVRDQIISVKGFFSNGEFEHIKELSKEEFYNRVNNPEHSTYNKVLSHIHEILSNPNNQSLIENNFPLSEIPRRNTGYAIDILANSNIYKENGPDFNLCHLLAGSEGTLFFSTEIELNCHPTPPAFTSLLCIHSHSVRKSLEANIEALKFHPTACELMDDHILECTKNHPVYSKYRFFVKDNPAAILVVEFAENSLEECQAKMAACEKLLLEKGLSYYCSQVVGDENIKQVWNLRKAGLGLLSNIPGDAKPAPVIEDTAVTPNDLPQFIEDFNETLAQNNLSCVHYAHAATGELHLRPILNLKSEEGVKLYRKTAEDIAALVKKYRGSLSGEHGDGRLRGEFIEFMYGSEILSFFKSIKLSFDEKGIFNPGKIVDTPPMDTALRYDKPYTTQERKTYFDWSKFEGYQRNIELCNGSGDCRKTHISGGVMCPSYMATLDEKHSTRGRSNLLRSFLSNSNANEWKNEEVEEALDLCLSCKACKSECPSNVDMAKIKAEYLAHQPKSLSAKLFAKSSNLQEMFSAFPALYNFGNTGWRATMVKKVSQVHSMRSLPQMVPFKFKPNKIDSPKLKVVLVADEFSQWLDGNLLSSTQRVLEKLEIEISECVYINTSRALISKGFVKEAKTNLEKQFKKLKNLSNHNYIIGIEPSAILGFRDEFPSLFPDIDFIKNLANKVELIEEFLLHYFEKHPEISIPFNENAEEIHYHGHCHQKTLSDNNIALSLLKKLPNRKVIEIKSSCCGMAGSFGYEEKHYQLSKKIAELSLVPHINKTKDSAVISASGFSCRHQIADFTNRKALHPIEILEKALK